MSDEIVYTEEYRGYTINISPDIDSPNPRKEWDNLGKMVCWHKRYDLGDEMPSESPDEYRANLAMDAITEGEYDFVFSGWKTESYHRIMRKIDKYLDDNYIIIPLYLYDHSGITISCSPFSCSWDSGQIGFIYISKAKVREEYGWKNITSNRNSQIVKYLNTEVKTYDDYLTGSVYGFEILSADGESVDSCGGYSGDYNNLDYGALREAKSEINNM